MRFAFDIGGAISKYPQPFRAMVNLLQSNHDIYIITDMPDRDRAIALLERNDFMWVIPPGNVLLADYATHGEACKAVLLREHGIDVLIDDHAGYLVWPWPEPAPLRLLVMPDPHLPYWAEDWEAAATDGDFGRKVFGHSAPAG